MKNLKVESLGPIKEADVNFGDLTLLVGPQASGKSIFIQMLKLIEDKNHIRRILEQYNFIWGKDYKAILDRYFGEGMHGIWTQNTRIEYDAKKIESKYLLPKQNESYKNAVERLFYVPAQRILCISDGRPKFFTEFDESVPYVLKYFSEALRQLLQNEMGKQEALFPLSQRLKKPLRESFNESIFHNGKIAVDNKSGQKKFKMEINKMNIPFMTWSAGQKEFMPLLLSFYWLCPSSRTPKRDNIEYVVIEEPEMGLHPQAIKSVILQIIDLLSRGYKVVVSTHSPVLLEFVWAFNYLKQSNAPDNALFELFSIKKSPPSIRVFKNILKDKIINTYYFQTSTDEVIVKDISSLDAGSSDDAIAEWGGLSTFATKATDIVSKYIDDAK